MAAAKASSIDLEHRGHGPLAFGNRVLHVASALANQLHGVAQGQRAGCHMGAEFAEAMAGGEARLRPARLEVGGVGGGPRRYQCGLLIGGELELLGRPFPHEAEQTWKGPLGFVEGPLGGGTGVVESAGHADSLRALAGEEGGGSLALAHLRPPQVSTLAAQVRPAPKLTSSRLSPSWMRPAS